MGKFYEKEALKRLTCRCFCQRANHHLWVSLLKTKNFFKSLLSIASSRYVALCCSVATFGPCSLFWDSFLRRENADILDHQY